MSIDTGSESDATSATTLSDVASTSIQIHVPGEDIPGDPPTRTLFPRSCPAYQGVPPTCQLSITGSPGGSTLETWNLSLAPDGTGFVIFSTAGQYITAQTIFPPNRGGPTLVTSSDVAQAAHFVPSYPDADHVCLSLEDNPSFFLTFRTDGMRIELNPLGNSNTPPTYQYFETAAFMPAAATTFENMVKLPAEFFAGDQAHFGDFESYFALRPDGSIAADQSSPDSATDFLIEAAGAGDDLLLLHVGTTYLVADAVTGLVTVSGTRDQATQFVIYATDAEGIVLATSEQTPRYWVINPTGLLTVAARESWSADLEHWMEMEPASSEVELLARMGVTVSDDWPTPCQQSTALFVWQCTGGLFLAAGLGPGIISGQPTPGFTAFVSSLSPRVMAAINAASNALSSTDIRIVAGAGVVCNLFGVLVDEGVWWKLVKMLFSAGVSWWVIPKVMSLAVTYFFAPAVEGILLLTSLLTWFVGVMQGAVSVGQNCGPGPSSNIQPTHQNKAITPVATA